MSSLEQSIESPSPSTHKWRQHFLLDMPQAHPNCIWMHACSVGEVASILPLIHWLHTQHHHIHLTVVTRTGMLHAQRHLSNISNTSISYLPWDLPSLMPQFTRTLQPALLLLAETEFWPGMLKACHKQAVKVVGINTRISDRSFPKYHATRFFWKRWLTHVDLFLPQNDTDAKRLIAIGVKPERTHVAGNLKYAIQASPVDTQSLRRHVDASMQRPIILLASSHEDEEQRILDMYSQWHQQQPDALVIIVPRHPERFEHVAELIQSRGHRLSRWSEGDISPQADVILIDAMGILQTLYSITDIAIIGGSLVPVGGHNPIEAAIYGRGVITGQYIQNFRDIMADMQAQDAAIIAHSDKDLEQAVVRLMQQPHELRKLNASAAHFMQDKAQVLPRICEAIAPFLPTPPTTSTCD